MKLHYLANETCVMKDCDELETKDGLCDRHFERYAYNRVERAVRSAQKSVMILAQLLVSPKAVKILAKR